MLGSALEVLRIVSILIVPAMPTTAAGDLAADRPRRDRRPTSGCRRRPPGAATPAGRPVEKGAPLFPRRKD